MNIKDVWILVVDDVNAMRVQIKEMLKTFGFRNITVAGSGEEAKVLLELEQYQMVLADWHMSPTDGMELLQYVRKHPTYSNVAFIMVSAESTKERVIEAVAAGVDDYILKPLTPMRIQGKVYDVLKKKQVVDA